MSENPPLDVAAAHRHFSADCFNRVWSLIDKPQRTPADDEQMVLLAIASLWHWSQRPDCTDRNLSIGHWQASRVYALTGQPEQSKVHGEKSLAFAASSPPFFIAYAHEAIARAAALAGDREAFATHITKALGLLDAVEDAQERQMLETDLRALTDAMEASA